MTDISVRGEQLEEAFMTNVVGNALLVNILKSTFHKANDHKVTRVITVSSELHRQPDASSELTVDWDPSNPLLGKFNHVWWHNSRPRRSPLLHGP